MVGASKMLQLGHVEVAHCNDDEMCIPYSLTVSNDRDNNVCVCERERECVSE